MACYGFTGELDGFFGGISQKMATCTTAVPKANLGAIKKTVTAKCNGPPPVYTDTDSVICSVDSSTAENAVKDINSTLAEAKENKIDFSMLPKYNEYWRLSTFCMDTLFGHITYQQLIDHAIKTGHEESVLAALCKLQLGLHEFKMNSTDARNTNHTLEDRFENEQLRMSHCVELYKHLLSAKRPVILTNSRIAQALLEIVNCRKNYHCSDPNSDPLVKSIRCACKLLTELEFDQKSLDFWQLRLIRQI